MRGEKCMQSFNRNTRREETAWRNVGVDGVIILKQIINVRILTDSSVAG
jgi:hypothetical protein